MGRNMSITYEYKTNLQNAKSWLIKTIKNGSGGSCATFSFFNGWSKPYPETTGYIIPTLYKIGKILHDKECDKFANLLADWLTKIQNDDGSWNGGLFRVRAKYQPSVFNTGQIIKGTLSAYSETGNERYLHSASKAVNWLNLNVDEKGVWAVGNYKEGYNPDYYTQVAWPMLEFWKITGCEQTKANAEKVLLRIIKNRNETGNFRAWGFEKDKPAFTHTIAYTLRGFLEAGILTGNWTTFKDCIDLALLRFSNLVDKYDGWLPGEFDLNWNANMSFSCLTGNAQLGVCLFKYSNYTNDKRYLNPAYKITDYLCRLQKRRLPFLKGSLAGSKPIYGKYMRFRYPNWATKYYADLLVESIITYEKLMEGK